MNSTDYFNPSEGHGLARIGRSVQDELNHVDQTLKLHSRGTMSVRGQRRQTTDFMNASATSLIRKQLLGSSQIAGGTPAAARAKESGKNMKHKQPTQVHNALQPTKFARDPHSAFAESRQGSGEDELPKGTFRGEDELPAGTFRAPSKN